MKRIACIMLVMILMLLVGCKDNESNDSSKNDNTSTKDKSSTQKSDIKIIDGTDFHDGVAFIEYHEADADFYSRKYAAIDTAGKILFELDDSTFYEVFRYDSPETPVPYFENGILVVENVVYDKTGTVIASPEISGYDELISQNCNGFVLAKKVVESFEGDKIYIGVLNNKGEWEYPLSSENPIVKEIESQQPDGILRIYGYYQNDSILQLENPYCYYDITTNELTKNYVHYVNEHGWSYDDERGVLKYDENGEEELVVKNVHAYYFFDDVFLGCDLIFDEDTYNITYGDKYKIYDYSGNVIIDLSEYNIVCNSEGNYISYIQYANEHVAAIVSNGTGANYLCLINKAGETVFEPIRLSGSNANCVLDENGLLYDNKLYDFSGNVTEYKDLLRMNSFNNGLSLVYYYDTNSERHYYYYMNVKGERVIG